MKSVVEVNIEDDKKCREEVEVKNEMDNFVY